MGEIIPMATLGLIGSGVQAGAQIYVGIEKQKAFELEASLQRQQARIVQRESFREAERVNRENVKFRKRQKLAFLKSGVSLEGSPLLVLEETQILGREEVRSILRSGVAQAGLITRKATITRGKGRAALISGIASGASTFTKGFSKFQKART